MVFFPKITQKTMMDDILKTLKQIVTQKLMIFEGLFPYSLEEI
jgi:hypothetical protein